MNPGVDRQIAVLVFLAAFLAWSVLVLVVSTCAGSSALAPARFRSRARRVAHSLRSRA